MSSKLHLKIRNYKAAITSFEIFLDDYPDSKYREELSYLLIYAQLQLAKISVETIKKEGKVIPLKKQRYEQVKKYYKSFESKYPDSVYLDDAREHYKVAVNNTKIK